MARDVPDTAPLNIGDWWHVTRSYWERKPIIARFRCAIDHIVGHTGYPHRLTISWAFAPEPDSGFPSKNDQQAMEEFENRLIPAHERANHAIAIAVVTFQGTREWIFYSSDVQESVRRLNEEFGDEEPRPLQLQTVDDPSWQEYLGIVRNFGDGA